MAHNRDRIDAGSASGYELPGAELEQPTYGILTRTLVNTPVVKQILSARIRSKEFNDVVFVGVCIFFQLYLVSKSGSNR